MVFLCKNCGANIVYHPDKKKMICEFCGSEESHEQNDKGKDEMSICPGCGGEVPIREYGATTKCPFCDNHIIFNSKVEGYYLPKQIIPFQFGKKKCIEKMKKHFKGIVFAPSDFFSETRLKALEGVYVPFWFYDCFTQCKFHGIGTKVRTWTTGNKRYTERKEYDVYRGMDIQFLKIPCDASKQMDDAIMDLMEPYDYDNLVDFKPEYLSGFYAEYYQFTAEDLKARVEARTKKDAHKIMQETYLGYSSMQTVSEEIDLPQIAYEYHYLPVWRYNYTYQNKNYSFYVNGQTGKVVGTLPISKKKVAVYSGSVFLLLLSILVVINLILMMW